MDFRKLGKRLLFPPVWVMVVLAFISTAALIYVFVSDNERSVPAYVSYALAFYTLSVICVFCSVTLPHRYRKIRQRIGQIPLANRYMTDAVFRTHLSLYATLGINLLYAGVNVLSFILYRSMWFVVMAGYYGILAVMRFVLVRYARRTGLGKDRLGELRSTRLCAAILLAVNLVLSGAVLMILYQNRGAQYHGMLIYVMAGYTFYITVHAVMGLVKYRKQDSPVMTMAKVIALSAALVSMLSLETAMFSQFGQDMAAADKRLMIALTGAGISGIVVILSIGMMVRSTWEIKKIRGKTNGT